MKKWIAFFSQTGSEISNVARQMFHCPDVIVTNKLDTDGINDTLLKMAFDRMYFLPKKPTLEEYETALEDCGLPPEDTLITLHGYLRIMPPQICSKWNIVNCHPALISKYPELKGFDPQKRSMGYTKVGTTLHKVTATVDDGPIISESQIDNDYWTVEDLTNALKHESEKLWMDLLIKELYN